ncbi:UNKNOWN [Stylonychia lemnae]|uniref:Uncharacterized protein n=1 Tax=Stylonychia lemnae TaxID=5949 RepID=A0A078ARD8_STYLE|nr:UNKNOWN [Stylonychia lemnae]|eukprot:CDW84784.1 UNKNOWN [Stylonychia lemnae]
MLSFYPTQTTSLNSRRTKDSFMMIEKMKNMRVLIQLYLATHPTEPESTQIQMSDKLNIISLNDPFNSSTQILPY